jgi:polyhydroxybutyrate depolymerase
MVMLKSFPIVMLLCLFSGVVNAEDPVLKHWTVGGFEREALVFAPTAGSPQDAHPLIFAFHGHGGNMRGFSKGGMLARQWPRAIVVYPQGLLTPSALDPRGRKPGWQRLAGDQGNRDLKFVDMMLTTLRKEYRVDDKRIYATGFSNGAFFSLLLWIERSDVFAGFAIVAGSLDPSQHLPTAKPVLHIAGKKDPKVTPAKVEPTVAEERRANGAGAPGQGCGEGCTLYHGSKADVRVAWHPGGHVYPPRAAALSVDFFKSLGSPAAVSGDNGMR